MALSMARPWKHPKTGTFYLRQRPPSDVVTTAKGKCLTLPVGESLAEITIGALIQVSLRTKDPEIAKVRHSEADAALNRFWAAVRHGPASLTHKQIVGLAGVVYDTAVRHIEDDPTRFIFRIVEAAEDAGRQLGQAGISYEDARAELISVLEAQGTSADWAACEDPDEIPLPLLERGFGQQADALLRVEKLFIDDASRALLLREIYRAMRQVSAVAGRNARGDYRPDTEASRFPKFEPLQTIRTQSNPAVTVDELFSTWFEKSTALPNTKKRYASSFRSFGKFVSKRDISQITSDDVYAWAEHRRDEDKVSARTVNRCDLANVSAVFKWGMKPQAGRIVANNPAKSVRLDEERRQSPRERTFRHNELIAILKLAGAVNIGLKHEKLSAAKRWCPWLAAYSGARISDLTALCGQDIFFENTVWVIKIFDMKTRKSRLVPIHEHLIASKFIDFVSSSGPGPLFFDENRKRRGKETTRAEVVSKALARWIRTETKLDPNVDPNHGWRHTWKTFASSYRIPEREIDAIVGHSPGTVARSYITPSIADLARAMSSFKRYDVDTNIK